MSDIKRASVAFTPQVREDLEWLMNMRSLNQNDAVSRAIKVCAFVEREIEQGRNLIFENPETGLVERIRMI